MVDPATLEAGDILIEDDEDVLPKPTELLVLAVGHMEGEDPRSIGVMYAFLDETPFRVYGPWIVWRGAPIHWSKKGESEVT